MIALIAVSAAAIAGGTLGGLLLPRRPLLGLFVALAVAWPVAIASLPLGPWLTHTPYQAGVFCFDYCSANLQGSHPLSGVGVYLVGGVIGVVAVVPVVVAAIASWLAVRARRRQRTTLAAAIVILAYLPLQVWFLLEVDAVVPLACLAIGAYIWSVVLARVPGEAPITDTPPDREIAYEEAKAAATLARAIEAATRSASRTEKQSLETEPQKPNEEPPAG
jgi:hypothetical protein